MWGSRFQTRVILLDVMSLTILVICRQHDLANFASFTVDVREWSMWGVQVLEPLGKKVHAEPCFWGGPTHPPPTLTRGMVDVGGSSFATPREQGSR